MINKKLYFTLMLLLTFLVPYAGAMDNAIPASSTTTTTIPLPTTTALLANAALAQTSALRVLATAEIITMRSSTEFEIALKAAIDSMKHGNVTTPLAPALLINSEDENNNYSWNASKECWVTSDRNEIGRIMNEAKGKAYNAKTNHLGRLECPDCTETYKVLGSLQNHIASNHSGGKKFQCECGSIMKIAYAQNGHNNVCTYQIKPNPVPQEEAPLEEETPHVKEKQEQAAHALVSMLLSASHNGRGKRHPASTRRRGSSSSRMNQKTNSTTHDTASNDKDSEIQEPPRKKVRFRGDWSGILSQVAPSTTAINNTSSSSNSSSASTPWRPSTYADRTEAARKAYEQIQLALDAYNSGLLPLSPPSSSTSPSSSSSSSFH